MSGNRRPRNPLVLAVARHGQQLSHWGAHCGGVQPPTIGGNGTNAPVCCFCACARACCRVGEREASFSSGQQTRDIQDYDNDALVVHMGAFEPPAERQHAPQQQHLQHQHKRAAAVAAGTTSDSSAPSTPSGEDAEAAVGKPLYSSSKDVAVGADGVADAAEVVRVKASGRGVGSRKAKVLNLYAIAAPGMRRVPATTCDITQCLSWGAPVELKRHWSKVQKGYFDAPGVCVCGRGC